MLRYEFLTQPKEPAAMTATMTLTEKGIAAVTTNPSAHLAVYGEVKRGHRHMEPKAPLACGGEAPTAGSEFFTAQ
ncbi:hypothetical protein AXK12_03440 [Cephaloticoccus capnophilus]|uniref:Uncharacterized protein n=1 Tax=Cephaloticoccus capnophilus TaxID=1548208 RepID=A0A139SPH2_9BACT|nr:hypothetical protein [Cephaloticoccus capnophilus]KXU36351.1 hypothetical protein AXK12_03440 [Cephaloticoccus capnophilus]